MNNHLHVLILAAGRGLRFGSDVPKQYCLLNGRPVLMWTIDAFRQAIPDANIVLVISPEMEDFWHELCRQHNFRSPRLAYGGAQRADSSLNGLNALNANADDIVLIHDAARPLVPGDVIHRVATGAGQTGAAIPVVPVTDSLRRLTSEGSETVNRSDYCAVQTPQGFKYSVITEAFDNADTAIFTDDASVVERCGHRIELVEGSPRNIKLTNAADMAAATAMLSEKP